MIDIKRGVSRKKNNSRDMKTNFVGRNELLLTREALHILKEISVQKK